MSLRTLAPTWLSGLTGALVAISAAALLNGMPPAAAEDPQLSTPPPVVTEGPPPSSATPSAPQDPEPPPPTPYAPTPGPVFNQPTGTSEQRYAINDTLVRAMDHAQPGSTMRIALYSGSIASFRDAVLAAYRRGVHVRLIMDGHSAHTAWWQSMVSAIGTDRSRASWTTVCRYGCFDTRTSTLQHSKLYLFSQTGTARRVVMVGSGNPTHTQATTGWNDLYTLVDDQPLYDAFAAYFDAMGRSATKADDVDYHRSTLSGDTRAIFFPSQPSSVSDYYTRVLANIRCTAAPGSGVNGRTKVTVAMGLWSKSRVGNAKKLWQLDEAGCDVEAIVASHDLDADVRAWLRKPGSNGGITFRAASIDANRDGKLEQYLHEKVVMVNGGYGTQTDARITFLGSHNFTYNAFRGNNEVILRITDPAVYRQFDAHIQQLRDATAVVPEAGSGQRVPAEVDLTQNFENLESPPAYGD